jgi:myo-inositol-1(or 4)-monophosphatase
MKLNEQEERAVVRFLAEQRPDAATREPGDLLLDVSLEAVGLARDGKLRPISSEKKSDESPVTALDRLIEQQIRARVAASGVDAVVVGEEHGGALPAAGLAFAVDPIDGTWAFLNAGCSFATSIAVLDGPDVVAALVANPSTGELIHVLRDGRTRLLELAPEQDLCASRELPDLSPVDGVHLHVHPSSAAAPLVEAALRAKHAGRLDSLRLVGGSPAWGIAECARGALTYTNLWGARATEPYDLAAAVAVLRGAGGEIVDLRGDPIDALRHRGPFIASASERARDAVLETYAQLPG